MNALLAASHPALDPSILAAVFSGASGLLLAVIAWRAQSYHQLLRDIRQIAADRADRQQAETKELLEELAAQAVREIELILARESSQPPYRRRYDQRPKEQ
jgi:hypothetical protein